MPVIPLFEDLSPDQTSKVMEAFETYTCPPDTLIIGQREPALFLYLIIKGRAVITYKPYDGPSITITRLQDGDVFGWSAVVGGRKYSSTVTSESALEAIRIRRETLLDLIAQQPDTGKIIIDRLALNVSPRWKNAHEQIKQLIGQQGDKNGSA